MVAQHLTPAALARPQEPGDWIPRGHCGPWTPALEEIYQWAHMSIFAAYFLIPAILLYAWRFERDGPQRAPASDARMAKRIADALESAGLQGPKTSQAISAILAVVSRSGALPQKDQNILRMTYAAFVAFCGVGHLEGLLAFFWPRYDLFAYWHAATAVVSWIAVAVTVRYRERLIVGK